jgi:hypothetical protein
MESCAGPVVAMSAAEVIEISIKGMQGGRAVRLRLLPLSANIRTIKRILYEHPSDDYKYDKNFMCFFIGGNADPLPDEYNFEENTEIFLLPETSEFTINNADDAFDLLKRLIDRPTSFPGLNFGDGLNNLTEEDRKLICRCLRMIVHIFVNDAVQISLILKMLPREDKGSNLASDFIEMIKETNEADGRAPRGVLSAGYMMDLVNTAKLISEQKPELELINLQHGDATHIDLTQHDLYCSSPYVYCLIMLDPTSDLFAVEVRKLNGLTVEAAANLLLKMINGFFFTEKLEERMVVDRENYVSKVAARCRMLIDSLQFGKCNLQNLLENIVARKDFCVMRHNVVRFLSIMIELTVDRRENLPDDQKIMLLNRFDKEVLANSLKELLQAVVTSRSPHSSKVINLMLQLMFRAQQLELAVKFSEDIKNGDIQGGFQTSIESKRYLREYIVIWWSEGSLRNRLTQDDVMDMSRVIHNLDCQQFFEDLSLGREAIKDKIIGCLNILDKRCADPLLAAEVLPRSAYSVTDMPGVVFPVSDEEGIPHADAEVLAGSASSANDEEKRRDTCTNGLQSCIIS